MMNWHTLFSYSSCFQTVLGNKAKIGILGALALIGVLVAVPSGLTSLVVTGIAVVGIAVVLITSVFR